MANAARNKYGLTDKMEAFCHALVYGVEGKPVTQVEAYLHAYDTENMQRKTAHNHSSRLVSQDRIAKRVDMLRAERAAWMRAQAAGDAERVRMFLRGVMAGTVKANPQQVRAAELLGKASPGGMFTDRQAHEHEHGTPEQQRDALAQRLRMLAGDDEGEMMTQGHDLPDEPDEGSGGDGEPDGGPEQGGEHGSGHGAEHTILGALPDGDSPVH